MKHRARPLASSEAEAIERVKQGDAEAFALLYGLHKRRVYSLEHNEIATMLGCSIGNSKSQLHKARMKLRESLKTRRAEKATKQYWEEFGNSCRKGIDALFQHPRLLGSFRDDTVLRRGTCGARSSAARS